MGRRALPLSGVAHLAPYPHTPAQPWNLSEKQGRRQSRSFQKYIVTNSETGQKNIPMVLHQGGEAWSVSTHFLDWLEAPEELKDEVGRFQPDFEHVLVDLSRMSVEEGPENCPFGVTTPTNR